MINTVKHLCYVLRIAKGDLEHMLKNVDDYYHEFESIKTKYGGPQKKDGIVQTRTLHPSNGRLKLIQKDIHKNILSRLPMPDYAFGSIKGRNNILNAKQHRGNKYFFSADLKKFFPSINIHMVYRTFISYGFSPDVSSILTRLTTYKGVLPQGAPTSPLLSNLVFVATASKIEDLIKHRRITFTTFLDDLTLSSRTNFKYVVPQILKTIQKDGFWLSHKKISYKTKSPEVTGIMVDGNKLTPHDKVLKKQEETNNKHVLRYVKQIQAAAKA